MQVDVNKIIQKITAKVTELTVQNAALEAQNEMLAERIWELENPEEAAARAAAGAQVAEVVPSEDTQVVDG